jgi:multidrug resistance efflux pump
VVDDAVRTGTRPKARLLVSRSLLVFGAVVTLIGVILLAACWRDDLMIEKRLGKATAEVVSVSFQRTVVRFATQDGAVHSPAQGVLYPEGLEPGQLVRIEYDTADPEVARVAGRTATLALLPIGTFLLTLWVVLFPLVWWLRRGRKRSL